MNENVRESISHAVSITSSDDVDISRGNSILNVIQSYGIMFLLMPLFLPLILLASISAVAYENFNK